jgi:hypothetical protein
MSRDDHYSRRLDAAADAECLMEVARYHDDGAFVARRLA